MEELKEYALHEFPDESPYLFGLHPNAEIGSLTTQTDFMFSTLLTVQPRVVSSEDGDTSIEKSVKKTLDEIYATIPDPFNITELYNKAEKHEPYVSICLQECERMNILMTEIKRSLNELDMGLAGDLTISEAMDTLMNSIYVNKVPATWEKLTFASLRPLMPWWKNLLDRHKQLVDWSAELTLPASVWLPGLFNPSSFLTAVAQSAARKNGWPLDQTVLTVEVTKKTESEIDAPPRDGAYIHGLFLGGARWDSKMNSLYMKASDITIFEALPVAGGSMDAAGTAKKGYVLRGGRMLNFPAYECLWDLMKFIPSIDQEGKTLYDETVDFNKVYATKSGARVVNLNRQKIDVTQLGLSMRDRLDLVKLMQADEVKMGNSRICEWFEPEFFKTNFWIMWVTTFAFEPWQSAVELRRYMHRFLKEFPRIHTLEGVARTVYNQYDSIIYPMQCWLKKQGVNFQFGSTVVDVDVKIEGQKKIATSLTVIVDGKETRIPLRPEDIVMMQNGSMTDASSIGSMTEPAKVNTINEATSFKVWEKLSKISPDFGNPAPFTRCVKESIWQSFSVTINDNPDFFNQMVAWSGNEPGTGALVTFRDSNWFMSVVIPHQPHFRGQPENTQVFWGYGLFPDRVGNYVNKPMTDCSGEEIMKELCGHLRFDPSVMKGVICIPSILPFITSMFMTRSPGDRPTPVPKGCVNLGFTSQFVEIPNDIVFTVEYSVRSAQIAVYQLLGIKDKKIPPISHHDKEVGVLIKSVKKAFEGSWYEAAFKAVAAGGLLTGAAFLGRFLYHYYTQK